MLKKPDQARLQQIFTKFDTIQAVYVFGSQATNRTHFESDLDLAIYPASKELKSKKLLILTELARHGFDNVDLIFLDGQDIVLEFEAVRNNFLVYQTKDFDRGSVYSNIIRKYLDFYPYLSVQRKAYKRRLLNGSQRSASKTSQ